MAVITDSVQVDAYKNKDGTREYGRCTAWVNFNGSGTVAIRDSLNVSSITDNGVARFNVNFAQDMDNTSYAPTAMLGREVGNNFILTEDTDIARTVSGFQAVSRNGANTGIDPIMVSIQVFGGDS